jgi:hypothetical protein
MIDELLLCTSIQSKQRQRAHHVAAIYRPIDRGFVRSQLSESAVQLGLGGIGAGSQNEHLNQVATEKKVHSSDAMETDFSLLS